MIKRVVLENWKSHAKSEFEFGEGTNVLVGVSGSGKTSVMDAICFALYGTFPLANARSVKLEEVIMQKPTKRESTKILLEFEYNNKKYEVERTINTKSSNHATLKENGSLVAGPKPVEVTKRIEEITDVDYELFSRAIYSEQNQADYFLKLNPAQRKEKIDDLLLINRYETARANAVSMQNRLKKQLEDKKNLLKEIKEKFDEKELTQLQKKIKEKNSLIQIAKTETKVQLEKLKKVESQIIALEKKEKEFDFFKELLIKSEAKTEELKEMVKETKKIIQEKSLKDLIGFQKETKSKKESFAKELAGLKEKEKEMQKQINQIIQEKGAVQEKETQKEKQLQDLESAKSACPVCNRKLEEHQKGELLKEALEEKKRIKELLQELEKRLLEAKKREKKAQEKSKEEEKELQELQKTELKVEERLSRAKELKQREKQLQNLLEETEKIKGQIKQMDFSPKQLEEQKRLEADLKEKIVVFEQEIKNGAEIIEQLKQNEKRLLETKKQILEFERSCNDLADLTEKVAIFVNTLKETQSDLRHSLINTVNEAMNDVWQNIYPYTDFESAKIEINEIGNYEIMVKQKSGPWIRVEGILSGGERSCVALTLRIAISLVLTQNLSWLILDEPTHNLDANTVGRLSQMMKNHLPELVEQIFIITHDKEMELAANASLYYLEREKDINGPTKPVLQEIR